MDTESSYWEQWEARFTTLASQAQLVDEVVDLRSMSSYLCLYGENGYLPQEELVELEQMAQEVGKIKKIEKDTGYWQEVVLFIP